MSAVTTARTPEEAVRPGAPLPRAVTERRGVRPRWGEIELYRILAALLVVAFHVRQSMQVKVYAPQRQGLHVGSDYPYQSVAWFENTFTNIDLVVDFFFVVSGFLLALPWVRSVLNGTPAPSVRAWAAGRAARAVPLYWLLVVVVWGTRNFGWPGEWRDLVEHLTFTQWLDSERIFYTIGPSWSLAVEIWLYPLIPLLLVLAARPARRRATVAARAALLALPVVAVGAASVAWKWYVDAVRQQPVDDWAWTFGMPAKADTFALGILLAIGFVLLGQRRAAPWVGVLMRLVALAGLVTVGAGRIERGGWWLVYAHSLAGLAWALLIAAVVLSRPGRLTRLVNNRVVVAGGSLTFALYISHEPLIDPLAGLGLLQQQESALLLNWAVFLPLSLAFAFLLHRLVERPAMRLRLLLDDRGEPREYYPELVAAAARTAPAGRPGSGPRPQRLAGLAVRQGHLHG